MLNPLSRLLGCLALAFALTGSAAAQEIWSGSGVSFSKAALADFTQAGNQDRITPDTWITRADTRGLFNIKTEASNVGMSPANTEWAYDLLDNGNVGQTMAASNFANLTFETWKNSVNSSPPGAIGLPAVLHLISEDIYIDITVTSWGSMAAGGGAFSYVRAADPPIITLSRASLSNTVSQGSNASGSSFTVRNSGAGTLSYTISDSNTNAIDWISVSPTSGTSSGETDTINVTYNTSGLPIGSYTGTITVNGTGATNTPRTINVSLTVTAQPVIALSKSTISASTTMGFNAPADSFTVSNSGGGNFTYTIVDMNSNAIDWISLSPTGGTSNAADNITVTFNTSGLPIGGQTGTITVSASGITAKQVSVTLTVNAVPTITLSTASVSPSATPGTNAAADSFTVTNTGGGTLSYTISDINTDGIDWISVNPSTGSSAGEADTINITYTTAALAASDYTGTITVSSTLATNSPQTINVALSVSELPAIALSKSMISRSVAVGSNADADSFTISNSGGGTLNYSITDMNTSNTDWITVSPTAGSSNGETDPIGVTFNTSGLAVGNYSGAIRVSAAGAANTPQSISVSLSVVASPTIQLSKSTISRTVGEGSNAPSDSFTVTNSGGGTLSYTITDENDDAIDWITLSRTQGTSTGEADEIIVNFDTSGLQAGNYTGAIRVAASGAANTPQSISVSLSVVASPVIQLSKSVISQTVDEGSNAPSDSFTIANSGGGTLSYTITDANDDAIDWIAVSPSTGTSTGEADTINITYTTAALAAGGYTGTITVSSTLATNSPQTIDVALSVSGLPTIALSKSMISRTVEVGSDASSDSFTVGNSGGGTLSYTIADANDDAIDWIAVSPSTGTSTGEADTINITYTTAALAAGDYTGTITVSATLATNSPRMIDVALSVSERPMIALSKSGISRTVDEGSNATSDSFTVANSGGGTLAYAIADANDDAIDWITLSRTQGTSTGEADEIIVNFDTAGLSPQNFSGTITVSASGATNSPQTIAVGLEVVALPPQISLSKSTLSRGIAVGTNAAADSFAVTNTGGGTLNYSIVDTNDDAIDWISLNPTSGSATGEADTILVSFDTAKLQANSYSGSISVSAAGVANSPQTIAISLTVSASPPTISLSRLVISRIVARGFNAESTSFTIANSGGETLTYSLTDTNDDPIDWISLNPVNGDSLGESDMINVDFDTTGLANGSYQGTIDINALGATNSPRSISVLLSVGGNPDLESRWDDFNWDTDDWGPVSIPEPSIVLLHFSALVALVGLHRTRARSERRDNRTSRREAGE